MVPTHLCFVWKCLSVFLMFVLLNTSDGRFILYLCIVFISRFINGITYLKNVKYIIYYLINNKSLI